MKIEVTSESSSRRTGRVVAAPAAFAGIVVCLVRIGVVGTLVVIMITLVVLFTFLRLYPAFYRRAKATNGEAVDLRAEASCEGKPGSIGVFKDRLEFRSRSGDTVCTLKRDVAMARLTPISRLILATRVTLIMRDGRETHFTITAGAEMVAQALAVSQR
jgi:hypothetical protein